MCPRYLICINCCTACKSSSPDRIDPNTIIQCLKFSCLSAQPGGLTRSPAEVSASSPAILSIMEQSCTAFPSEAAWLSSSSAVSSSSDEVCPGGGSCSLVQAGNFVSCCNSCNSIEAVLNRWPVHGGCYAGWVLLQQHWDGVNSG